MGQLWISLVIHFIYDHFRAVVDNKIQFGKADPAFHLLE